LSGSDETLAEATAIQGSLPRDLSAYQPHAFHATDRDWPETNCYVDLWIEILNGRGLEVAAMFPFTFASDFEGDQWTFYKPPHADLFLLYGIEVEELTVWKALAAHCVEQVGRGRMPLVEMDSYFLPDTRGRAYRETHTKTTVGVVGIDPERRRLRYFHNRGLFELEGSDYDGLFRSAPAANDSVLAPYCEFAKFDRLIQRESSDLRERTRELLRRHLGRRPERNPIRRYAERIDEHLSWLIEDREEHYDLYAFAAIRQCGSCFAFSADCLRWLGEDDERWLKPAEAFSSLSSVASMLVMKMARIVYSGRLADLQAPFTEMAEAWDRGMEEVDQRVAP